MLQRDSSLDALKAVSICFVLIWHLHPVGFSIRPNAHKLAFLPQYLVKIFEYQVLLVAVPTFIIVSLYLFFLKQGNNYFKKRIYHLLKVFLFWSFVQIIVSYLITQKTPRLTWKVFIGIHPPLPLVYDSVLYYLFDLTILTIVAFLFIKLKLKHRIYLFYIFFFATFLRFEISSLRNILIPYWSLENFILYIPIAFYLYKDKDKFLSFKRYYLVLFLIFSAHDIYLFYKGNSPSMYGRLSIFFGALSLVSYVYSLNFRETSLLKYLATYSLGLYALHKYWYYILLVTTQNYKINLYLIFQGVQLNIDSLFVAILTIFFSILTIHLMKYLGMKRFIS